MHCAVAAVYILRGITIRATEIAAVRAPLHLPPSPRHATDCKFPRPNCQYQGNQFLVGSNLLRRGNSVCFKMPLSVIACCVSGSFSAPLTSTDPFHNVLACASFVFICLPRHVR
ncbi:hypothetical protein TRVL_01477 [Trypanosoma vivax]|uniref:Uncharacterized protein n=1 Tax=Trypanosoma vivax (strain Y486) TaxID=1055687 RepID=G0TZU9_TRYVY|nr:hypothetical protein TRVL_01477 [Trypanosoma vivax]CCC50127.1 hypothetical protein TVY486_0807340 [Trypanosoma vivax Y486]